jgi:3-methylfumaryl-CoA hydratase
MEPVAEGGVTADGEFAAWVGRAETATDSVTIQQIAGLAATLDLDEAARQRLGLVAGGVLPALWHWLAFLPTAPMSGLGPDGHPKRGGFLPPVPLERRMWAGGRLQFEGDIRIGEPLERRSTIRSVQEKAGRAGSMVFVTVEHRFSTERGLAIVEEHDIVYVAIPDRFTPPPPVEPPAPTAFAEAVSIDTVKLFRFSAVTFNGHRIHYDLDYTREVEKYPGLVVHGPLQAVLMMEAARRHQGGAMPKTYGFRGVRPLFHFESVQVVGTAVESGAQHLATVNGDGHACMQATVTW